MLEALVKAKKVGTPIVAIRTPDQNATIKAVCEAFRTQTKMKEQTPLIVHDIINGMVGIPDAGELAVSALCDGKNPQVVTAKPPDALQKAINEEKGLPTHSVLFMKNAHIYIEDIFVRQAIGNLRDEFKQDMRMLILLGPDFKFPPELASDIVLLDEALPDMIELKEIVSGAYRSAKYDEPDESTMNRQLAALIGLPAFPAEQCAMVSLDKDLRGIDTEQLWERKRKAIEQVPGLSVFRGRETFDIIGGCMNVKDYLMKLIAGQDTPNLFVFIDEIEKAIAGATGSGGDSSGVAQSLMGTLLSWMQDFEADGVIFIGPPGAAKSAIAKAAGNTAGVPTVQFDLNGMKDSLVGASEANLRAGLKTVQAMGQGRVFFIATCNRIADLPPELRRRFTMGTFFFDLPDDEERKVIWDIYLKAEKLDASQPLPDDTDWTGAEIKQCAKLARKLSITLREAAAFIVPVAISASDQIEELRTQASGKFISASKPGYYQHEASKGSVKSRAKRGGRILEGFGDDS